MAVVCWLLSSVFYPTSASWLNRVERWFAKIIQQRIAGNLLPLVKHLEAAILDYIQTNNRNPKPFVWTATADLIFAKIPIFINELMLQHTSALLIASRARLLQEQRPSACCLTFARYL